MHRELIQLNQPMTGVTISDLQAPTAGTGQRILTPAEIEEVRRNQLLERSDQTLQAIQGIQEALTEMEGRRSQSLEELQQIAVELAVMAAEHMTHRKIESGEFGLDALVKTAVQQLGMNEAAALQLHPDDLDLLKRQMADLKTAFNPRQIQLVGNPGLDRGTVRLVGESGRIVMSTVASRLSEIKHVWMENLDDAQTERRDVPTDAQQVRRYPDRRETA
ncbi:MAG: FliH/SctL family protein [Fuerstiella sp.]